MPSKKQKQPSKREQYADLREREADLDGDERAKLAQLEVELVELNDRKVADEAHPLTSAELAEREAEAIPTAQTDQADPQPRDVTQGAEYPLTQRPDYEPNADLGSVHEVTPPTEEDKPRYAMTWEHVPGTPLPYHITEVSGPFVGDEEGYQKWLKQVMAARGEV